MRVDSLSTNAEWSRMPKKQQLAPTKPSLDPTIEEMVYNLPSKVRVRKS